MKSPTAAIDCGTNTIKLLVTGASGETLAREARMVRLGEGVDATGRLSPDALQRTFAAIDEYALLVQHHEVRRIRFCATSATRDAENAEEFAAGVAARLGVRPEVLTGEEEAALAFAGAVEHLGLDRHPDGDVLVVDIGGGSTEVIVGTAGRSTPRAACSMDIGSVRLHERHLRLDPPGRREIEAAVADIERALDDCPFDLAGASTVIGVAGTITTVAAGVLGLASYDREAIDRQVLAAADVREHVTRLVAMTVAERRALGWMHPGRADVIGAGALILSGVLARCQASSLVVSECDILDGIAASLVA
ncbi:Ppx/GppA phosphatase family protein [Nocardioides sp.]|uniref:Ppx/GppA phosphatase family protein n=1 Tax=Nocardioides sp. TaxID=35761 RepID=UPI00321AD14F